eukprot:TRINITY_DN4065_c0_g1_i1.p1 TRINITY_DN4065_c0_g1~~TRINITY_DN4065_c0_g1_i1.p1  ORF type:complete len:121 (+),score=12.71 TRINITY_DN4065_c0_g1_i1:452-814(+)
MLIQAAKHVEKQCDAIDINLGCPKSAAKKKKYGAFLLDKQYWPLLHTMVHRASSELSVPIFCKIRLLKSLEDTIQLATLLQNAGCKMLAVHGRTRKQIGRCPGPANFDYIREIKSVHSCF